MPSPPVTQWSTSRSTRACQGNQAGLSARRAPRWSPPIQIRGTQAMALDSACGSIGVAEEGWAVVVVMLYLVLNGPVGASTRRYTSPACAHPIGDPHAGPA